MDGTSACVFGSLGDCARYEGLHPHFAEAFAFLRRADLAQLPCGRYEIAGPDCWATISEAALKPFSDQQLAKAKKGKAKL